ncbi:MAG TPA: alpha/beta hydrolase [bacterium]|nr:alpha/beta hydrolase [bacterium]
MIAAAMVFAGTALHPGSAEAVGSHCQKLTVPVNVAGVPDAHMYGELCTPIGSTPDTVQVLVHSTWYNLESWDPPQNQYSYVQAAVAKGYATFNLDRFGTGQSSTPPAHLVTIDVVEDTIHQLIVGLRNGSIGGHAYDKVVWVGASFGSAYGWVNGNNHPGDADAYVLTGILHITKPSFIQLVLPRSISACDDPVLRHRNLDCNYITNRLGTKGDIYYHMPTAAPGMVPHGVDDAVMRDVVSAFLLAESVAKLGGIPDFQNPVFVPMPVETDYARGIQVPTLIVIGDQDKIFCGAPDGIECTEQGIRDWESPYFTIVPDIIVIPDTGHEIALHTTAPAAYQQMLNWIDQKVGL